MNNPEKTKKSPRSKRRYFTIVSYKDKNLSASATDLTESQIGLVLPYQIFPGEKVELTIKYTKEKEPRTTIKMKARVSMTQGLGGNRIFRTSLEILEIHPNDKEKFQQLLQEIKMNGETHAP